MTAEEILSLIRTMEPNEIERLLVLMKAYEAELRHRPGPAHHAVDEDFKRVAEKVFSNNEALFTKLAALERREREAQSNME